MSKDNSAASGLVYFLLGAAAGAAIALLYAPQEGEATRRLLTDKANEVKDRASEVTTNVTAQARDKWSQVADKAQDLKGTVADKAQDLINRGQQVVNDTADKARTGVNAAS